MSILEPYLGYSCLTSGEMDAVIQKYADQMKISLKYSTDYVTDKVMKTKRVERKRFYCNRKKSGCSFIIAYRFRENLSMYEIRKVKLGHVHDPISRIEYDWTPSVGYTTKYSDTLDSLIEGYKLKLNLKLTSSADYKYSDTLTKKRIVGRKRYFCQYKRKKLCNFLISYVYNSEKEAYEIKRANLNHLHLDNVEHARREQIKLKGAEHEIFGYSDGCSDRMDTFIENYFNKLNTKLVYSTDYFFDESSKKKIVRRKRFYCNQKKKGCNFLVYYSFNKMNSRYEITRVTSEHIHNENTHTHNRKRKSDSDTILTRVVKSENSQVSSITMPGTVTVMNGENIVYNVLNRITKRISTALKGSNKRGKFDDNTNCATNASFK